MDQLLGSDEGVSAPTESDEPSSRDIDILFRETNRLYYELARGCGLTDTAYWILFQIVSSGGSISQRLLSQTLSYSRQTVNTSVKMLESKGLIAIEFEQGSRKCKQVSLTDAGQAFCDEKLIPAMEAEARAFKSLSADDRRQFVRIVRSYATEIDRQLESLRAEQKGGELNGRD